MANAVNVGQSQIDLQSNAAVFDQGLFEAIQIDGVNWSQYMPYQLVLVEAVPDGSDVRYKATKWRFTLPIGPQSLDIDLPNATDVKATLTGITEIHGGAPFRMIQLSGTTGIVPTSLLPDLTDKNTASSSRIFGGTIKAAQNLASAASGGVVLPPNVNKLTLATTLGASSDSIYERSTGYYQFALLRQFLESYIAIKSNTIVPTKNLDQNKIAQPYNKLDPRTVRLAFACWKDKAVYLCTLQNFRMSRSAANPMEYMYTLSLKAWGRVTLDQGFKSDLKNQNSLSNLSPSALQKAIQTVQQAIAVVSASIALVQAVVQDVTSVVNSVVNIMRTISSALKAVTGAIQTISDLPDTLQNECLDPIRNQWRTLRNQWDGLTSEAGQAIDAAMSASQNQGQTNPALSASVTKQIDFNAPAIQAAVQNMLSAFSPNQLQLPPSLAAAIKSEQQRVSQLSPADFAAMQDTIETFINDYTDLIGLSDPVYAELYGRPIKTPVKEANSDDFNILYTLQDVASILDGLSVSAPIPTSTSLPSSIDYIAGLAEQSGIAFKTPTSKFAIPFPYGATLEGLAQQYLGNVNRWMEIAALNGLQAPWVDEEGLNLPLIVNADANTVIVSDASNLFLGQTVYLAANGTPRITRHIVAIDPVSIGYIIVTLDGTTSLTPFTVAAEAQLQFFTPNTVNSQKSLYIPSDQPSLQPFDTKDIPGVDQFDPLINLAGLALAVDNKNDLIFSPSGRSQLAVGLQNVVQKVRLYLGTPLGSILQYPALGFSIKIGANLSEVNAQQILDQAKKLFSSDPTFSGIRSGSVQLRGPALIIQLDIGLAGLNTFLPVSIQIN